MKLKNLFLLGASLAPCVAHGALSVYTADANTLHLYHLDETAAPLADSGTGTTHNLTVVSATTGAASYTGFGTALSYTVATNAAQTAGNAPQADFQSASGAFTYDLMVNPGATVGVNTLLARDHTTGGPNRRSFIFRLNGANIDFIRTSGTVQTVTIPLPVTGAHAFAAGQWFHIAVAYNGTENTAGNFSIYWTALGSGATQANLLGSFNLLADVGNTGGESPFTVGNRDGANNVLPGTRIDEVRVSNIARGAGEFIFVPEPSSALLGALGLIGILRRRRI